MADRVILTDPPNARVRPCAEQSSPTARSALGHRPASLAAMQQSPPLPLGCT
jgi:hypothetical protein